MLFNIDVRPPEVRTFLRRLVEIPGNDAWKKREQDFELQVRESPIIGRYLDEQFGIERSFIRVRRYQAKTGRLPDPTSPGVGALYGFAAMVTRTHQRLSADAQRRLTRRIYGALKDGIGLAPLDFEMRTVQHFMSKGFDVEFSDLCHGGGHDFTMRKDEVEIEVECKSIGGDLGRKIHLMRQYHRHGSVRRLPVGKNGVVRLSIATMPDRLFPGKDFLETVASKIAASCSNETGTDDEVCSVSYHEFPIGPSPLNCAVPPQITQEDVIDYCKSVTGKDLRHVMMIFSPGQSATVVAVRSAKPDEFLLGVSRQLKEAAKQLSQIRPGVICAQFRNLTSPQLRDVAGSQTQAGKPTSDA